jgi:hypothetical protein
MTKRSDDGARCPACGELSPPDRLACIHCGSPLLVATSRGRTDATGEDRPEEEEEGPARGRLEVTRRGRPADENGSDDADDRDDLFSREATPRTVTLVTLPESEARDLIRTLEAEGIGARLEGRNDGSADVLVHDPNLPEAQAALVEFTGELRLVDEIDVDDEGSDSEGRVAAAPAEELVPLTTVDLRQAGPLAGRLLDQGLDVRLELPPLDTAFGSRMATLYVRRGELARARESLGIVL